MKRRVIFTVLGALFVATQSTYAGVINSYVTNLGNAERTSFQDRWTPPTWEGWDRSGNTVWGISGPWNLFMTHSTWLQVALPGYTGNITEAMLFVNVTDINVTDISNGQAATLYHTFDSSSATGDATQGLNGDGIVSGVANPALGWFGLDVTPFIQHDYEQNYGWAAFQFNPSGYFGSTYYSFGFSIAEPGSTPDNPGNAPYLRITTDADDAPGAVPEPGTLLLFGLGGTALLLRARARGGA
jgi:hypothetical protein